MVWKGDAEALWLRAPKRYEAAISAESLAFLLCSRYLLLSDERSDSIRWATAPISEATGVTQIYSGLSQGDVWPRETRDQKTQRWESCVSSFREYPWICPAPHPGYFYMTKDLELPPRAPEDHFTVWSVWKYFLRFHLILFNSITCYVKLSKVYIFFHTLH